MMRHINVKLDDDDWNAFERLRGTLNERRRQPLTISTVLRLVIQAGIKATEAVAKNAAKAPVQAPKEPALRWETHVTRLAGPAEDSRDSRKALYDRFERRCDREQLTPHQVAEELRALDPALTPAQLNGWYYRGEAPSDEAAAARLLRVVAEWLETD
jgi:hypothetical protein